MRVSDIPDYKTIFQCLFETYLRDSDLSAFTIPETVTLSHSLDLQKLKSSVDHSIEKYGLHPWQTKDGAVERYSGFSLCFNPHHVDQLDPHASSLGTPRLERGQFFYASYDKQPALKNSYFDSFAFTRRTPAASDGYLAEILNSCKRTLIRSRMMIIDGKYYTKELISAFEAAPVGDSRYGWHRDEPVYANLRINLPITSGEEFVFQIENETPYGLEPGKAYSWNTNIPHRVYCRQETQKRRYNLVIGVSPWFDYDRETEAWIPNQFCGKKHPLQMLRDGNVFDWLKG